MAKVYLDENESNSFNGNVELFGNTGIEGVLIKGTNNEIHSTVEEIRFTGDLDSYQFYITGNVVTVQTGSTVVASITVPDTATGQTLIFADGLANLVITALDTATLGGAAIPTTPGYVDADLEPAPPLPSEDGHLFTLQAIDDTPAVEEQVLMWGYDIEDGGIPVTDLLDFLTNIAGLDFKELGLIDDDGVDPAEAVKLISNITISDLSSQGDIKDITIKTTDGQVISAEASLGHDYFEFLSNLLFTPDGTSRLFLADVETEEEIEGSAIVLTPTQNNGGTFESGFTTSGDDTIVAGYPELLHGAYIDGGGGYNTLEVEMKGAFAQPLQLINIQQINIENLPNVYTEEDGCNDYPWLSDGTFITDSTIDLSRATDLERLVITEGNFGDQDGDDASEIPLGELYVVGVRNNATTRLEGGFTEDVTVHYGQGVGPAVNLELQIGDNPGFDLKIAHNASVLNLLSDGYENTLDSGDFGGNLSRLNITGEGTLNVEDYLEGFRAGTAANPAVIDASGNSGGVILSFLDQPYVKFIGSTGNDAFAAIDSDEVTILGGNGNNEFITDDSDIVNITSGTGNDTISSIHSDYVNIDADGGNNTIVVSANEIHISTGDGDDVVTVSGRDITFDEGYDPLYPLDEFAPGALLDIEVDGGYNTVILGRDIQLFGTPGEDATAAGFFDLEVGVTALEGSSISGTNITLVVENHSDLTQAELSGITTVVLGDDLTVTTEQFEQFLALGEDNFYAEHAAFGDTAVLEIVVGEDFDLSALDLSGLSASVKLVFDILDDATLTLTAEQLHLHVAEDGIDVSQGANGNVVLTDVGLDFDPFDDNSGGGSLYPDSGHYDDLDIVRSIEGYERPTPDHATDTLYIDSDVTPLITESFESELRTLVIEGSSTLTFDQGVTVELADDEHDHDNWDPNADFGGHGHHGFTVDFSALEGELLGLTLEGFDDVKEVIGNDSGARINVELCGDVGRPGLDHGLRTTGVATYVVTDLNGEDRTFYTCDNTQDVQTLGLQGNWGNTLTFAGLNWVSRSTGETLTLLLEGDGYADFTEAPKADYNPDESNIGTLRAEFFWPGAPVDIRITNQGELLGQTSTGEDRPIVVEGIELFNARSADIYIEDGDAQILSIVDLNMFEHGDHSEHDHDYTHDPDEQPQLENLVFHSDFDVDLHLDAPDSELEKIDATEVAGDMTLVIDADNLVDLSDTTLYNVDAVVLEDYAAVTLTVQQINEIGVADITLAEDAEHGFLNIGNLADQLFVAPDLAEGIEVGTVTIAAEEVVTLHPDTDLTGVDAIFVPEGTTLNMTAAQFEQLDGIGYIYYLPNDDPEDDDDLTTAVNITGLTQEQVLVDLDEEIYGLDLSGVDPSIAGTLTLAEDVVLDESTDLGAFDIVLADDQTITLTNFWQADGREIDGGAGSSVVLDFTDMPDLDPDEFSSYYSIDASGFHVTEVHVLDRLIETEDDGIGNNNVEELLHDLPAEVKIVIFDEDAATPDITLVDRVVDVVAGTTISADVIFDDLDPDVDLRTLDITMLGDATITGDLSIPSDNASQYFDTLTINSKGDLPNEIAGSINGGTNPGVDENNFLNVVINAEQDFSAGSILFTSVDDEATAHLTVNTLADGVSVTIGEIQTNDADVDNLVIEHNGEGDLYVTGGSAALQMLGDEKLTLVGDGDMVFGTEGDLSKPSINEDFFGVNALSFIDASDLSGDLDLGVISGIDEANFTFTSGTGYTELTLGASDELGFLTAPWLWIDDEDDAGWTFDLTNAYDGSTMTITEDVEFVDGDLTVLLDDTGTLVLEGDVDFGDDIDSVSILGAAGEGGIIDVNGVVDFTTLQHPDPDNPGQFINELDLTGIDEIVLGSGGAVAMTDQQYEAFVNGGGVITGDTVFLVNDEFINDHGNDLTQYRGFTGVQIDAATTAALLYLTAEQAVVAYQVDVAPDGTVTRSQWDDDANPTTPNVDRADGDFTGLTTLIDVVVTENADITDLQGVFGIDVEADAHASLVITGAQADALLGGDNLTLTDMAGLTELTIQSEYQTVDPDLPPITVLDIDVDITHDANGNWQSHTVTGAGGAIGIALHDSTGGGFQEILDTATTITQLNLGGRIAAEEGTYGTAGVQDILKFVDPDDVSQLSATTIKGGAFDVDNDITGTGDPLINDVLDFTEVLNTVEFAGGQTGAYSWVPAGLGLTTDITDAIFFVDSDFVSPASLFDTADIANMFNGILDSLNLAAGENAVIYEVNHFALTGQANIWYIVNDANAAVEESEISLVGVVENGSFLNLDATNFGI